MALTKFDSRAGGSIGWSKIYETDGESGARVYQKFTAAQEESLVRLLALFKHNTLMFLATILCSDATK